MNKPAAPIGSLAFWRHIMLLLLIILLLGTAAQAFLYIRGKNSVMESLNKGFRYPNVAVALVTSDPSFHCKKKDKSCEGKLGVTALNNGTLSLSQVDSTDGYTISGNPCSNFNRAHGNLECPFRSSLSWKFSCADKKCSGFDASFGLTVEHKVWLPLFDRLLNKGDFQIQLPTVAAMEAPVPVKKKRTRSQK